MGDSVCLYCGKSYATRERLFQHLKKMIPKERMITGWHQYHFHAEPVTQAVLCCEPCEPGVAAQLRCPAKCCAGTTFETAEELLEHLKLMGVCGAEALKLPVQKQPTQQKK